MAAIIELDEVNGAGLVLRHGILHTAFGSIDAYELDEVANSLALNSNSYEKWQQVHVPDLMGSAAVKTIRYWSGTPRPAGSAFVFNGHLTQASYDTTKKTTAGQPGTGIGNTPNHVPAAAPTSANIGIGGVLVGSLTAPGSSDFIVAQIRLDGTVTQSAVPVVNYDVDDIA